MELKKYQKDVISDLSIYLDLLSETQSPIQAYNKLWNDKGVIVGLDGMDNYKPSINGVPQVCIKVPTGGGKTFIAANAIKPIFDSMSNMRSKAVVWLVPSDAILTQTLSNLSNSDHPYRQKIDVDFAGRTDIYTKNQLLNGQNFNPTTVNEQLSVFVLSYDSFRTKTKDGRKAFQQNGYLGAFAKFNKNSDVLLDDIDETALIQVIRSLNPVVIVDESHHATSDLSVEMLSNFNPYFVLDLTATPKKGSNIISFVDASQLKKENMVKLPIIVYNRKSQNDVFLDAITIRHKLEAQAKIDEEKGGKYIRPIVLFQAESKNKEDSTTYDKIRKNLIDCGIPKSHIATKTADKNELKDIDLLSPNCPIRFIITVNALKEGWDCPFAYILATVANRSSAVDVEQILGRVLRLPNAKKNSSKVLNLSYVITSSSDFNLTLEKVVAGLNNAGFSSKDYRAKEDISLLEPQIAKTKPETHQLAIDDVHPIEEDISKMNVNSLKEELAKNITAIDDNATNNIDFISDDEIFSIALEQSNEYEIDLEQAEETAINTAPQEVRDKMNVFKINKDFVEEIDDLLIPQFAVKTEPSFFTENYKLLTLDDLVDNFTLKDKDVKINFATIATEMARVDIDNKKDTEAKAWKMCNNDSPYFKEWFNSLPSEKRLKQSKNIISHQLSKIDGVNDKEREEYINRVVENMTADQIADFEQSPAPYISKIKDKINNLINKHRMNVFTTWLEQDKIQCKPLYKFKSTISPTSFTTTYPKSLYTAEESMNDYEKNVVFEISSMENVKWWHRNISRLGFQINGAVHAYPDLIIMLHSGKTLMVETKGDHLDNEESKIKSKIGAKWAEKAGSNYRYYMVFESKSPDYVGAYSLDKFLEIVRGM